MAGIAVPSIRDFIYNARVSTQATELMTDLAYARSESIARGRRVTVCSTTNATSCASASDWAKGRLIFVDTNGNGALDTGTDTKLRTGASVNEKTTLSVQAGGADVAVITYFPYGGVNAATNFTVCLAGWPNGRQISVAATGRATISSVAVNC